MTTEELESKFEECFDAHTRASEGGYGADTTDMSKVWQGFHPAILDYAKQQAIAFMKLVDSQHNQQVNDKQYEAMYNSFIEQQNKP